MISIFQYEDTGLAGCHCLIDPPRLQ